MIKKIKKKNFDTLRFITCGSVDDGKSTLLGRLLYDNKSIYEDQLAQLKQDTISFHNKENIDFSLLLDGLIAEREQKITIDVSYRYFHTSKRNFIIADSPGHEEYTKNMVTGASNSDLAIILVNAEKGILEQTIRHSFICSYLNIKHIVLAINKMDKVKFSEGVFNKIKNKYEALVKDFKFNNICYIPVSALHGDNVVNKSKITSWYKGSTLLKLLENIKIEYPCKEDSFLFPVQLVTTDKNNIRRYLGTLRNGNMKKGEKIKIYPSEEINFIKKIYIYNKKILEAKNNYAITIELKKQTSLTRGDIIVSGEKNLILSSRFEAKLVWLDKSEAFVGRLYNIKVGHTLVGAQIIKIINRVNFKKSFHTRVKKISYNDLVEVIMDLEKKIPIEEFLKNCELGSFILIDRITNNTIAAGMVKKPVEKSSNIFLSKSISKKSRNYQIGHKSKVIWFTGLSGSGKSTLAQELEKKFFKDNIRTCVLDGDNLRFGINKDLGFTDEDRIENIRRVAEISKLMVDTGVVVLTALISPFKADRSMARLLFSKSDFIEVFVNASLETVEKRDVKGLYKKARKGEIPNFTGIDSPYEIPDKPEITINTNNQKVKDSVDYLYLSIKKIISF